jgi:hypothetical protein
LDAASPYRDVEWSTAAFKTCNEGGASGAQQKLLRVICGQEPNAVYADEDIVGVHIA